MAFSRLFKSLFALALIMVFLSAPAFAADKKILVFGDSLVAGHNIPLADAFPAQLENKLRADGHAIKVINAGVSGDTTSGGLTRLDWSLAENPDYVILELGANDMLRAVPPTVTRDNLKKMLDVLKARKTPVLLAGMHSYKNLGESFGDSYETMYKELAAEYDAVFYPFFLDGIAMNPALNIDDGMHPNPKGVLVIVDKIYPSVQKLLEK